MGVGVCRINNNKAQSYIQYRAKSRGLPLVTFVVPSKGRVTFVTNATLQSIVAQDVDDWRAIFVYDGVQGVPALTDDRIEYKTIPKSGVANHAAQIRNYAMSIANSWWFAWVDDDDTISRSYVKYLLQETSQTPGAECVIFRMATEWHGPIVLPPHNATDFEVDRVGISFAIRADVYHKRGFFFIPGGKEDYIFLDKLRKSNVTNFLSAFFAYYVKGKQLEVPLTCSRAVIN